MCATRCCIAQVREAILRFYDKRKDLIVRDPQWMFLLPHTFYYVLRFSYYYFFPVRLLYSDRILHPCRWHATTLLTKTHWKRFHTSPKRYNQYSYLFHSLSCFFYSCENRKETLVSLKSLALSREDRRCFFLFHFFRIISVIVYLYCSIWPFGLSDRM